MSSKGSKSEKGSGIVKGSDAHRKLSEQYHYSVLRKIQKLEDESMEALGVVFGCDATDLPSEIEIDVLILLNLDRSSRREHLVSRNCRFFIIVTV